MPDNTLRCNSCGFPLNVDSPMLSWIKCPKCGVINIMSNQEKNASGFGNGSAVLGIPLTADGVAIHKSIVSWICRNHIKMPPNIFQGLRLTEVEKIYAPCYLFECSASIRYSYQIGNNRERFKKEDNDIVTESYVEYTHQNDVYDYTGEVLVSGISGYSDIIRSLYKDFSMSDLVDVERLGRPSGVKFPNFDVPEYSVLATVKEKVEKEAHCQILKLLKGSVYKNLQVRDSFHVDYGSAPKQALVPLIKVAYSYNNKTGVIWLSGNAERIIVNDFPKDFAYQNQRNDLRKQKPGCASWTFAILATATIVLSPIGIPWIISLCNKDTKVSEELDKLRKEHLDIFIQFLDKQMPLNGVLQKEVLGKPEAFPEKGQLYKGTKETD